jgi:hypothetical protein
LHPVILQWLIGWVFFLPAFLQSKIFNWAGWITQLWLLTVCSTHHHTPSWLVEVFFLQCCKPSAHFSLLR